MVQVLETKRNFATLHQLAVLAFVGTRVDLLCHSVVFQALYAAAHAVLVPAVAVAAVNVVRCEGIGQTVIALPCALLVRTACCLFRLLILVVLFADMQEEQLLEGEVGVDDGQGQLLVVAVCFEVGAALPPSVGVLHHLVPMAGYDEG